MSERTDVYQRVTNQIIEAIENGTGEWERPWNSDHAASRMPVNVTTGKSYRGVNVLSLWSSAFSKAYVGNKWGTFKQWSDMGCAVRRGEKSTTGVFWKDVNQSQDQAQGSEQEEGRTRRILASAFALFHSDQVDGFEPEPEKKKSPFERVVRADAFFGSVPVKIVHLKDMPFYDLKSDLVNMPRPETFKDAISYYSTLAHEATHWTGHPSRLAREMQHRFGDEQYAAEELIAELGAAFIAADLELEADPRVENAPYIQSWLRILKSDKYAIFNAAGHAQRAADFLHQFQSAAPVLKRTSPAPAP